MFISVTISYSDNRLLFLFCKYKDRFTVELDYTLKYAAIITWTSCVGQAVQECFWVHAKFRLRSRNTKKNNFYYFVDVIRAHKRLSGYKNIKTHIKRFNNRWCCHPDYYRKPGSTWYHAYMTRYWETATNIFLMTRCNT